MKKTSVKRNMIIEEKHQLLFKAAFGPEHITKSAFDQWMQQYSLTDLDWSSRFILPLLVQYFPEKPKVFDKFTRYYQQTWLDNLKRIDQLKFLINDFHMRSIPVCLLKGTAMLLFYYKNFGMRPGISDTDMLVPRDKLIDAIKILKEHGYRPVSTFRHSGHAFENHVMQGDANVMRYHHAITYQKGNDNIDLHWRCSPLIKGSYYEGLATNMQKLVLEGNPVYALSPEYQVMHISLHGVTQISDCKKTWWIIDLLYLLKSKKHVINWEKLCAVVKQYHSEPFFIEAMKVIYDINPHLLPLSPSSLAKTLPASKLLRWQNNLMQSSRKTLRQLGFYSCLFSRSLTPFGWRSFLQAFVFLKAYFGFQRKTEVFARIFNKSFFRMGLTINKTS